MADSLGVIRGQMILDVKQALAAYTAARAAHLSTMTALSTGASALAGVSLAIAGVGIAMGAGILYAVNAAAEFERKLDFFGAVSESTQAEYEAIRKKALELGQDTIFSAGQIADSFVELGKAGVSARDILDGVGEGVAALGAAADIPLDVAAQIMLSAVQTFGLGADQAVHVADLLAGAANASIVEVQDLGVSLKYAGGVAAALSIPLEDVITALGLLGKAGIKGSTAGTSLRQTMVSLGGKTKKAETALKALGIITEDGSNRFFNADGTAKSLAETFQILQEATAGMTDQAKLAAFKDIFDVRALPSVIALTKAGAAGFNEMSLAIGKTTAAEVASKRLDNLSGDLEILRGNIETLAIESGSVLQDFFRGFVQGITQVIQWFSDLSPGMQEFIIKAIAVAAIVFIVVGAMGLFASAILNVINLFLRLGPVFTLLKVGIGVLTTGFRALAVAMFANPIGLIILGVIALVAAFIYLWNTNEGFRNFWIQLWETIKSAALAVWEWFKTLPGTFSDIWNSIKTGVETAWNAITEFFASIPEKILSFFLNWTLPGLLIQHWDTITAIAKLAWNSLLDFFRGIPDAIAAFFDNFWYKLGFAISFAIGYVIRLFIDFSIALFEIVSKIVAGVIDWFSKLPGRIAEFFTNIANEAGRIWGEIRSFITTTVQNIVNSVINFFQQLPARVAAFFQQVASNIGHWLGQAAATAKRLAQDLVNGVLNFLRNLPGNIANIFNQVVQFIQNAAHNAYNAAVNMARNIWNAIWNTLISLPSLVWNMLNNAISAIYGVVRSAFNAAASFARGLWDGFKAGLGIHSPSYIERAMWAITGVVGDETARLKRQAQTLQGLGNGISELGETVGSGFGMHFNEGLTALADQVAQAKKYEDQLNAIAATSALGSELGVNTSQTLTLDAINDTLAELAARPQIVNNVEVNNPVPERTTDTLGRVVRKSSYVGGSQ